MKKVLQVLLHLLGFPLLIAAVVLINLPIIKGGISYGVMVFVGIIVTVVMAIIYYIAFLCNVKSKKKSKFKQTVSLILVVFFTLCGFWVVVDFALPDFFADATSNTVYYEDLVDNYEARAIVQEDLLKEYIRRAYNAGNLPNENVEGGLALEDYLEQGMRNETVKELLTIQFASIDKDGYASFAEPWIGMGNADRLTIPVLIHLLLDDRTATMETDFSKYEEAKEELQQDPLMWNVLDMMGKPMDIDAGFDENTGALITTVLDLVGKDSIGNLIGEKDILGSPIYVSANGSVITLTPSNESRGYLDYMSMAWLNSNGLLYAIVTLISIRNLFLIFAGWMILTNFLIGILRGMGKDKTPLVKVKGLEKLRAQQGRHASQGHMGNPYSISYVQVGNGFTPLNVGQIRRDLMRQNNDTQRPQ